MSIVSGEHIYFYMVRDNLCYLTMTEKSYPKRMAFLYLDEVADAILSELVSEFQNDVSAPHRTHPTLSDSCLALTLII